MHIYIYLKRKHAIRDEIFRMQLTSVYLPFVKAAPSLMDM